MPPDLPPLHRDLDFLCPLADARAADLCNFVATRATGTVVDVGCGWAELLIRVLEANPALAGLGVDLEAEAIDHGRGLAETRGVADRLALTVGDAKELVPDQVGGVICIGSGHIWGPPLEDNQPLGYQVTLESLRGLLEPGMPAVFGDLIWAATPTEEAAAKLGGRLDEFVFLPDLLDIVAASGFGVVRAHQANLDEWDRFESGFTAGYVSWLLDHSADHPDRGAVSARLDEQRNSYFRGYRGILGQAYLELVAT